MHSLPQASPVLGPNLLILSGSDARSGLHKSYTPTLAPGPARPHSMALRSKGQIVQKGGGQDFLFIFILLFLIAELIMHFTNKRVEQCKLFKSKR